MPTPQYKLNGHAPSAAPERVRLLPRHAETDETFSVLSDERDGLVAEYVFRADYAAHEVTCESFETRRVSPTGVRDVGAGNYPTGLPFEVLQRAADKLARKVRNR